MPQGGLWIFPFSEVRGRALFVRLFFAFFISDIVVTRSSQNTQLLYNALHYNTYLDLFTSYCLRIPCSRTISFSRNDFPMERKKWKWQIRSKMPGNTAWKAAKFDASMSQMPAKGLPYFSLSPVRKAATVSVDSVGNFTLPKTILTFSEIFHTTILNGYFSVAVKCKNLTII